MPFLFIFLDTYFVCTSFFCITVCIFDVIECGFYSLADQFTMSLHEFSKCFIQFHVCQHLFVEQRGSVSFLCQSPDELDLQIFGQTTDLRRLVP
jgi:hypothetical protein